MSTEAAKKEIERADYALNRDGSWTSEERTALAQIHATLAIAEAVLALAEIMEASWFSVIEAPEA